MIERAVAKEGAESGIYGTTDFNTIKPHLPRYIYTHYCSVSTLKKLSTERDLTRYYKTRLKKFLHH